MMSFNEFMESDTLVEATLSGRSLRSRYMKLLRQLDSEKKPSDNYLLLARLQLIAAQISSNDRNKLLIQLK
jgi:hypothetical protein